MLTKTMFAKLYRPWILRRASAIARHHSPQITVRSAIFCTPRTQINLLNFNKTAHLPHSLISSGVWFVAHLENLKFKAWEYPLLIPSNVTSKHTCYLVIINFFANSLHLQWFKPFQLIHPGILSTVCIWLIFFLLLYYVYFWYELLLYYPRGFTPTSFQ